MRRNPIYNFKDLNSLGIYDIPLGSSIIIQNADNQGNPKTIILISKNGLRPDSTIKDLLNTEDNYIDPSDLMEIPSELKRINYGNGKYGWRLLDNNGVQFVEVGNRAVDLSNVTDPYAQNKYGAQGDYSFASGVNTIASGVGSIAVGINTVALGRGAVAFGTYNKSSYNNN